MKSKSIVISLVVLLVIAAIILITLMVIAIVDKDKNYKMSFLAIGNKTELLFQGEFSASEISDIEVSNSSSNIKFVEGSSDKIKVTIYGLEKEKYSVDNTESKLEISKEQNEFYIFSLFVFVRQEIIIELPKEYSGEIRNKAFKRKYRNDGFGECKC